MRVLISGYYGFGNAGDEAVLHSLTAAFRSVWEGSEFVVLSANPADTEARHGVTARARWRPDVFLRELRRVDLFASGGGSLFQDATSFQSLGYYLAQLELARWAGTPRIVAFQGVGPLRRLASRTAVAAVLQETSAIVVRDRQSAELLRKAGVLAPPLTVGADPAILLDPGPAAVADDLLTQARVPTDRPLLAVSVRPWASLPASLPALCVALQEACDRWGLSVLLLPLHRTVDREVASQLRARLDAPCYEIAGPLSPPEWVTVISRCRAVVGMRLHALIFAVAAGVPAVGLSYDPKVTSFVAESQQHLAGTLGALRPADVLQPLEQILSAPADHAAATLRARERLRTQVRNSLHWLAKTLG